MMYTAESTSYGKLGMDTTSITRTQFVTQTKRFPLIRYSASLGVRGRTWVTLRWFRNQTHMTPANGAMTDHNRQLEFVLKIPIIAQFMGVYPG